MWYEKINLKYEKEEIESERKNEKKINIIIIIDYVYIEVNEWMIALAYMHIICAHNYNNYSI